MAEHTTLGSLIEDQAEDEGLWFIAQTAPEAYLQQELRRLHAAAESLLGSLSPLNPEALRKAAREIHALSDSPELAIEVERCADLIERFG